MRDLVCDVHGLALRNNVPDYGTSISRLGRGLLLWIPMFWRHSVFCLEIGSMALKITYF